MTGVLSTCRWLLPVAVLVVAMVGCSDAEVPAGLRGSPMVVADGEGVCGLLAGGELELVLDAPVETGGGRIAAGGRPGRPETVTAQSPTAQPAGQTGSEWGKPRLLPGMEMCRAGSREGHILWGAVAADDSNEPLEEVFASYREWHGDDLEGLRVDGYDALWDEELRTLVVLGDEHAVGIQLTIPDPPVDRGEEDSDNGGEKDDGHGKGEGRESLELKRHLDEDEAAYLREQAAELASRALRRL